jgi:putative ABC transport system substrate-binding protein
MESGRRRLLGLLGGGFAALALPALAQAPKRIGLLHFRGGTMNRDQPGGIAFLAAMKELGYLEGRDFIFDEHLWQRQEEAPELVRELVRLKTDLIIAASPASILAAKNGTTQIPVVIIYSAEPVAMGIVSSLARPGGNLTGLTYDHGFESSAKSMELLKETMPRLQRVAVMWDGTDSAHPVYAKYFARAASQVGLKLVSIELKQVADLEPAFIRMKKEKAEALVVLPSGQITVPNRHAIMRLAARDRMPTLVNIVDGRDWPGALLRYGPNFSTMPRRAAAYVDRIFKGARPTDIPIEQPDKYDFVVDVAVARKLGIAVPHALLARADKVIE